MKLEISEATFNLLDEVSIAMRTRNHNVVIFDLCMGYLHQKDFFEKERQELEPDKIILNFNTVIELNDNHKDEGKEK